MGEINVVPYIDVMLVLLVIFMVTAPLLTQGIEVDLPKAAAEPIQDVPNSPPLVLSVDREGNLYIVIGAMVVLQQGGADSIGFVTDPLDTYPIPE
jgi:biopolymer transport protein TolR